MFPQVLVKFSILCYSIDRRLMSASYEIVLFAIKCGVDHMLILIRKINHTCFTSLTALSAIRLITNWYSKVFVLISYNAAMYFAA